MVQLKVKIQQKTWSNVWSNAKRESRPFHSCKHFRKKYQVEILRNCVQLSTLLTSPISWENAVVPLAKAWLMSRLDRKFAEAGTGLFLLRGR